MVVDTPPVSGSWSAGYRSMNSHNARPSASGVGHAESLAVPGSLRSHLVLGGDRGQHLPQGGAVHGGEGEGAAGFAVPVVVHGQVARPRGGRFLGLQQGGFAGVGLLGGDHLEQVLAEPGQPPGVVVPSQPEQMRLGLATTSARSRCRAAVDRVQDRAGLVHTDVPPRAHPSWRGRPPGHDPGPWSPPQHRGSGGWCRPATPPCWTRPRRPRPRRTPHARPPGLQPASRDGTLQRRQGLPGLGGVHRPHRRLRPPRRARRAGARSQQPPGAGGPRSRSWINPITGHRQSPCSDPVCLTLRDAFQKYFVSDCPRYRRIRAVPRKGRREPGAARHPAPGVPASLPVGAQPPARPQAAVSRGSSVPGGCAAEPTPVGVAGEVDVPSPKAARSASSRRRSSAGRVAVSMRATRASA